MLLWTFLCCLPAHLSTHFLQTVYLEENSWTMRYKYLLLFKLYQIVFQSNCTNICCIRNAYVVPLQFFSYLKREVKQTYSMPLFLLKSEDHQQRTIRIHPENYKTTTKKPVQTKRSDVFSSTNFKNEHSEASRAPGASFKQRKSKVALWP